MKSKNINYMQNLQSELLIGSRLILIFLLLSFSSFANDGEKILDWSENKTITKSFAATSNSTISITNKYGNIDFTTWDKDSVSFQISIAAEAEEAHHAKMLLSMVEIDFNIVNNEIQSNLIWGRELNAVKRSAVDMMLNLKSNQRIQIDYKVFIPKNVTIKVENRFGNVNLPEETKKCYIEINHGDLRASKISDARSVFVRYGKIDIKEITNGDFDLGFSDLSVVKADEITIKSTNCELMFEDVNSLTVKSTNDRINIEKINKVSGMSSFTNFRIRSLVGSVQLLLRFGEFAIRKVHPTFSGINLDGSGTDVSLAFDPNYGFKCTITMENQKSFNSGFGIAQFEESTMDKTKFYEGSFGKNATEKKLIIKLKSSHVRLESSL